MMKDYMIRKYIAAQCRIQEFKDNIAGSESTEKIGMVVVAVVIIGMLAAAVKVFMPGLFNNIGKKAENQLLNTFS